MATTTPNYGWSVPESTDLVKDGATAIELLGDSIDASFVDLLGGTTGQVLTKASGTDLDFSFTTPATSGGFTSIASGALSTGTLSITGIVGTFKDLRLVLRNAGTSATCNMNLRVNNLTTGIYSRLTLIQDASSLGSVAQQNVTSAELNGNNIVGSQTNTVIVDILDYANTTSFKQFDAQLSYKDSGTSTMENALTIGNMNMTAAIDRIDINLTSGTFNAGTFILYGGN